jgi:ABC-type lipoprotein export system ATPase subunit
VTDGDAERRPRGSEWAKWDLHVHTPDSLVQRYGRGGVDPWEAFLDDLEALPSEFRVIGVNDYLFLDGYRKLLAYKKAGRIENIDLLLPVVELRLNHFAGTEGNLSRPNLHVLFSEELDPDVIQSQFINGLKCDLALTPNAVGAPDWASIVTRESLRALGSAVKATLPEKQRANAASDLLEGFNNFNVTFDNVLGLLRNPLFTSRYMLAMGRAEWADMKWKAQSAGFKKTLVNLPHWIFTSASTPLQFQKSRDALLEAGLNGRLIDGSDAHQTSSAPGNNRIGRCMTWVNSIPTFEGLRHAYHEYDTRVFIGETPPKLSSIALHPTNYLDHLEVHKVAGSQVPLELSVDLPLNPGFVAIVGNKGKGKSALTDVIGHLGHSRRQEHYSFLTSSRFREVRSNPASKHEGRLRWATGAASEESLSPPTTSADVEAVQYLPQSFLESVCNEGPGTDDRFTAELGEAIFSHVPEEARLGTSTLEDLVRTKTEALQQRVAILRAELLNIVRKVIELEVQLDPSNRLLLENQVAERKGELEAHEAARPDEVSNPADAEGTSTELERQIEAVRVNIVELEQRLLADQQSANEAAVMLESASSLRTELENIRHQVATSLGRIDPLAKQLGLNADDLVAFTINFDPVEARSTELAGRRDEALGRLSVSEDGTPARLVRDARAQLAELEGSLDAPNRAYQGYLSALSAWEGRRAEIIGSAATPDSLRNLESRLERLDGVPARLSALRAERLEKALEIHDQLMSMAAALRDLYAPVQDFIDSHPIAQDRIRLAFEVVLVEAGLSSDFFAAVSRQATGSFAGANEGGRRLQALIEQVDFQARESVRDFLEQVDNDLRHDNRDKRGGDRVDVATLVRKGATVESLYSLLFGLEYLTPQFWLQSDGRPLSQLSPGQRGTLLLLFYLLVDRSMRPIVLDQPEENLDNQTIHEVLVPAIAEARQHRQVITVTHNPNLAVVGDADQVIVADIEAARLTYISGAISDPVINEKLVSILEGTWPAFSNRRDKYIPVALTDEA